MFPWVTVSMIGGAIRARVELETEPTRDMKRSSLGTAAAREKVRRTRPTLRMYSALRWWSGWTLQSSYNDSRPHQIYQLSPPLKNGIQEIDWNIELEGEGEEYREGHHDLHQYCQADTEKFFYL